MGTIGSLIASCLPWFYDSHCFRPRREAAGGNKDPVLDLVLLFLQLAISHSREQQDVTTSSAAS